MAVRKWRAPVRVLSFSLALTTVLAPHAVWSSAEPARLARPPSPPVPRDPAAGEEAARLLERWAPVFVQHVAPRDAGQDRPTRVDFDGDWVMVNNWANQAHLGTAVPAYAYGGAVLTETHAYLTYSLFYPRDWERPICLPYVCHENDLENVLVVVRRGGEGELQLVETKTHRDFVGRTPRGLALEGGRPLLRVEAYGHGTHACAPGEAACAPGQGRIVYTPGRAAGVPPPEPRGERVPYALLSMRDTLWQHRDSETRDADLTWEDGADGRTGYVSVSAGRVGRPIGVRIAGRRFSWGASPPWGQKAPLGARGAWFLDPAHVVLARFELDGGRAPGARRYVWNPYLDDLAAECSGRACPEPAARGVATAAVTSSWASGGLALALGMLLRRLLRGRQGV